MPRAKTDVDALVARGVARLLAADDQTLTESQFLEACGRGASKKRLKTRLDELVEQRTLLDEEKGGRRWLLVPKEGLPPLLRYVVNHLPDNARCIGQEVKFMAQIAVDSLGGPTPVVADAMPVGRLGKREDRVLQHIIKLSKKKGADGRVKVSDLLEPLGFKSSIQLAGPLQKLARSGRVVLDPLMNPMAVSASEKAKALHLPGQGLIFWVSLSKAWKDSVAAAAKK